mmetsp:Transcript_22585/g.89680  ORF Transcript_22585/g.89680 Transcript_22585/m.89680 type:complete len:245 (+) Transcript_22585:705-1439(+)
MEGCRRRPRSSPTVARAIAHDTTIMTLWKCPPGTRRTSRWVDSKALEGAVTSGHPPRRTIGGGSDSPGGRAAAALSAALDPRRCRRRRRSQGRRAGPPRPSCPRLAASGTGRGRPPRPSAAAKARPSPSRAARAQSRRWRTRAARPARPERSTCPRVVAVVVVVGRVLFRQRATPLRLLDYCSPQHRSAPAGPRRRRRHRRRPPPRRGMTQRRPHLALAERMMRDTTGGSSTRSRGRASRGASP